MDLKRSLRVVDNALKQADSHVIFVQDMILVIKYINGA